MIIKSLTEINDELFNKKFANKFLEDKRTLRIGNIISNVCPVTLISTKSDESINFCIEIPEISNYAGVCFQQLFITNLANIISNKSITSGNIEIVNGDIIIKKEHTHAGITQVDGVVSTSKIYNVHGAILIYVGLFNKAGESSIPRAFSLNLDMEICYKLMDMVNENFYHLANNIFLKTSKI